MKQLMTIGEFAERCGLSRSTLRFYDQNGLVQPQAVDAENGYRYYALTQADEATLVRRLRAAELPVELVREYLAAGPERRAEILDEHARALRARADVVQSAIDELRNDGPAADARGCLVEARAFDAALQQVLFALPEAGERPELDGIWVEVKDGSLRLVATDSYRLAVRDLAGVAGLGRGDFPDYERILDALPKGHQITVARDELARALARLPQGGEHLALRFGTDGVTVRAGDGAALVHGRWSGAPLELHLAARFFREAVHAAVGPDILIEAIDPFSPVIVRSADTGTFSVLTMPVRPDPDPPASDG